MVEICLVFEEWVFGIFGCMVLLIDMYIYFEFFVYKGVFVDVLMCVCEVGLEVMIMIGMLLDDWELYCKIVWENVGFVCYLVGVYLCLVDELWLDVVV